MKSPHYRGARYGRNDGQVLVLFLFFSVVLILFVGLGLDLGFAYITKAQLSKALDASSLAAVSNYSGTDAKNGSPIANGIAKSTFWANYGSNGLSGRATTGQVTPVGFFTADATTGVLTYTNTASTTIHTYFLGVIPQWKTLTVGDTAVATRAPVVMTLVLDRTGSMDPNGPTPAICASQTQGGKYLPGAVKDFINIFDEGLDRAALVSFASSSANDVKMTAKGGLFKNSIISTVSGFTWAGGTCSIAGLTNALVIQDGVNFVSNVVKAVVFFTDGRANMSQGVFNRVPYNFGGIDPIQASCPPFADPGAFFYLTNTAENAQNTSVCDNNGNCGGVPTCGRRSGLTIPNSTFTNANGIEKNFCASWITEDATNRCVLIANQMRASGNYVYAVGLTAGVNPFAPPLVETLQQIANDPDSSKFDPTLPVGAAFLSHGEDLTEVFKQVAADIILRLVQ